MMTRAGTIEILIGWLVLGSVNCSGRQTDIQGTNGVTEDKRTRSGDRCVLDADCASAFCDRGICADTLGKGSYGAACEPIPPHSEQHEPPPQPGEVRNSRNVHVCGGYLCIDRRCRSCQSESECPLAGSTCANFDGWPGKQCGRKIDAGPPAAPPPPPMGPPGG
jgi:hypothetical protein